MSGGGGFEIWQYTSKTPVSAAFDIVLGDTGVYATKIKSRAVEEKYHELKAKGANIIGGLTRHQMVASISLLLILTEIFLK